MDKLKCPGMTGQGPPPQNAPKTEMSSSRKLPKVFILGEARASPVKSAESEFPLHSPPGVGLCWAGLPSPTAPAGCSQTRTPPSFWRFCSRCNTSPCRRQRRHFLSPPPASGSAQKHRVSLSQSQAERVQPWRNSDMRRVHTKSSWEFLRPAKNQ